jgi:hypothetical protein
MEGVLVLVLVWFLVAVPVAILLGMAIHRADIQRHAPDADNHIDPPASKRRRDRAGGSSAR